MYVQSGLNLPAMWTNMIDGIQIDFCYAWSKVINQQQSSQHAGKPHIFMLYDLRLKEVCVNP